MAWVSFHEMSQAHTFDWSALRIPDPARADRQKNWTCHAPLVPDRGLTPLEHVAHASRLLHPFHHTVRLETDLRFAIDACVHLGLEVGLVRETLFTELRRFSQITAPLDSQLLAARPVHHVPGMKPALIDFMIALLQWPDRDLPRCLVDGFAIVGDVPLSGIFRPVEPDSGEPLTPLLGNDAEQYVNSLEKDVRSPQCCHHFG